jgi:DNA repair protein SbcD/Mre11
MRIAHLADLHLGYRQYNRSAPSGINAREADVARTFAGVIDDIIALAPDLVVVAGDVFHTVRPSNVAVRFAFKEFKRLAAICPVIIAAGNHDLPRAADVGSILGLLEEIPRVSVADRGPRRVPLQLTGVLVVPDIAGAALPPLRNPYSPYFAEGYRGILVLHGEVAGALPASLLHANDAIIPVDALHLDEWDYVALGHYHVHTEIAPNCFYSGSIDYTSSNPWGELQDECRKGLSGKSFIEYDTETRTMTRHPIRNVRPHIDLPVIDASGLSAAEVDARIASAVSAQPIDDAIVRCTIREIEVQVSQHLAVAAMRDYKRRAFAFVVKQERPEHCVSTIRGAKRGGQNIGQMFAARLAKNIEGTDISTADIVALGEQYLAQADEMGAPIAAEA